MWEAIEQSVWELLVNVVISLLGLLAAYVVYYINQAAKSLQQKSRLELADRALERLQQLAVVAVEAAEQTTASALRKAVKTRGASKEELLKLGRKTVAEVLQMLDKETTAVLVDTFGDVERVATHAVESAVLRVKEKSGKPQR